MRTSFTGEILSPERLGGQGLDGNQEESGNRAILALLRDADVADHVDLVITHRDDAYEVWAARGMIRFQRTHSNGGVTYRVVEQHGINPIADQSHTPIATCADELRAAAASGHPAEDANHAFIEPPQVSYPYAYERIAQLFDSPYAPDLIVSPKCYAFGRQLGQHGALDIVQSRAPLAFAGPGIKPGTYDTAPRHIDIAPTICRLMGFPLIDGKDATGQTSSERGVDPDVYLKRQDGRALEEILGIEESRDRGIKSDANLPIPRSSPNHSIPGSLEPSIPSLVYVIIFDGLSNSELTALIERDDPAITNLRRVLDRSARFRFGSTVNFPSITWPSHSTIFTGAWCGHHDIVNPTYYARERREALAPQGQGMMTESYLGDGVETLYEAFHRVLGPHAFTANINEPQGRGADHAALERRVVGPRDRLRALTDDFVREINPRFAAEQKEGVHREAVLDARGLAQIMVLFDDPSHPTPILVAHEFSMTDGAGHDYGPHSDGLRAAIAESDARLGRVLDLLSARGLFERTLFVFTADHGMAAQNVALHANPARHPERIGIKAITGEPMIWLRDLDVQVEPAPDGRTARVIVLDNDADPSGEKPPVAGAEVLVCTHADRIVATLVTNAAGVAGFATPADVPPADIVVVVHHPDFNSRHLRLDGTNLVIDLRRELYG